MWRKCNQCQALHFIYIIFITMYYIIFTHSTTSIIQIIYFPHCTPRITTGSFAGRENQYMQLVKVL